MSIKPKRLENVLAKDSHTCLSPYVTAGFPSLDSTVNVLHELVKAGADIIELGMPFSEPMAEGVVIQRAMEVALDNGVTTEKVLEMVSRFRQDNQQTPIILMGYMNPIETMGYDTFAKKAIEAGVDGTIIVDLPPEESDEVLPIWQQHGLDMIYLCSSTTSNERMLWLKENAGSYVYYVSLKGVTGSNELNVEAVKADYEERSAVIERPLFVGFGIKTPEQAQKIGEFADGVVVGAAFINKLTEDKTFESAYRLIADMRQSIDNSV